MSTAPQTVHRLIDSDAGDYPWHLQHGFTGWEFVILSEGGVYIGTLNEQGMAMGVEKGKPFDTLKAAGDHFMQKVKKKNTPLAKNASGV